MPVVHLDRNSLQRYEDSTGIRSHSSSIPFPLYVLHLRAERVVRKGMEMIETWG